jgi:hypothetical protein
MYMYSMVDCLLSPLVLQTGQPARFDFRGDLVLSDVDIPVNQGLHHHGDEPEVSQHICMYVCVCVSVDWQLLGLHIALHKIRKCTCHWTTALLLKNLQLTRNVHRSAIVFGYAVE